MLRCKKPLRRSSLGPKTYDEAVARRIALQNRRRENGTLRTGVGGLASGGLKQRTWHRRRRSLTPEEIAWQEYARERDGKRCRWVEDGKRCTYTSETITVHHIQTRRQRPDLVLDNDNSACLCDPHHDFAHHSVEGRRKAAAQGLLGGTTYEKASKQ